MRIILYVAVSCINGAIGIITLMMFIRAILSWFPIADPSSGIMRFIYAVTEAVISPVRRFLDRFPSVSSFPIDISFLVTYLLLHLVQTVLVSLY